ncbi:DUF2218 domain-containing protein [Moraxella sp. RCAD0137]|uniref:DUF2218 domain-containing protein n=1 Tax=Moraxella sp. RCAD0137 TaxID=1775913 RepID=UPI000C9FA58E|nr:DUF2218 domain-containing protein [Moraxella sp. RCAD0137]PNP96823.1 hypothetical protein AZ602_09135 [Moraxella sp. RCAD0137]
MSVSTLQLSTEDAARIIKRLANHWRHKMTVSEQPQGTVFEFSPTATATLASDENTLKATLVIADEDADSAHEQQLKLQQVILSHINRMAGVDFDAQWQN